MNGLCVMILWNLRKIVVSRRDILTLKRLFIFEKAEITFIQEYREQYDILRLNQN